MNWIKVNNKDTSTLPPLDKIVWIVYRSGFDDGPIIQLGGRGDYGEEGWIWGHLDTDYFARNWDSKVCSIEADDDYDVTYWAEIEWPEDG